jgi:hypothetical protein
VYLCVNCAYLASSPTAQMALLRLASGAEGSIDERIRRMSGDSMGGRRSGYA